MEVSASRGNPVGSAKANAPLREPLERTPDDLAAENARLRTLLHEKATRQGATALG